MISKSLIPPLQASGGMSPGLVGTLSVVTFPAIGMWPCKRGGLGVRWTHFALEGTPLGIVVSESGLTINNMYQPGGARLGLSVTTAVILWSPLCEIGRSTSHCSVSQGVGVDFGPVDVVRFAEAFNAKGLKIETPDQISFTIKKALEMQGPVIIGVEVDYRDNYRFVEIMHPDVLD